MDENITVLFSKIKNDYEETKKKIIYKLIKDLIYWFY